MWGGFIRTKFEVVVNLAPNHKTINNNNNNDSEFCMTVMHKTQHGVSKRNILL